MSPQRIKLRWANKILRSKHFVAMTDKESGIFLDGVNPESITDVLVLNEQAASLSEFKQNLTNLIEEHDIRAAEIMAKEKNVSKKEAHTHSPQVPTKRRTHSK